MFEERLQIFLLHKTHYLAILMTKLTLYVSQQVRNVIESIMFCLRHRKQKTIKFDYFLVGFCFGNC